MADSPQKYFFLNLWTPAGIDGGSQKTGHEKWMELDDWDFSMQQIVDSNKKQGTPGATSAAGSFGFTITHNGPAIFKLAANTMFFDKTKPLVFEAERGGLQGGTSGVYFQLTFTEWVVNSRSIAGNHAVKTEHIEIVFGQVNVVYRQVVNGVLGPPVPKYYDLYSNLVK